MNKKKYIILGAGGHARVLIETLRGQGEILACLDPRSELWGKSLDGVPVKGSDQVLDEQDAASVLLVNAVGTSALAARRGLFEKWRAKGFSFPPIVAPSAVCASTAKLAAGAQALTRSVVHPGAVVGENTVINTGAIIEHDCLVGAHVFVGPGAILCGAAKADDGCLIGAGAVILPGVRIGAGALIPAGTVVRKDIPAGADARTSARLSMESTRS